jgi:hypothetical protein
MGALETVATRDIDKHAAPRGLFLPAKPAPTRLAQARKRHYTFARPLSVTAHIGPSGGTACRPIKALICRLDLV